MSIRTTRLAAERLERSIIRLIAAQSCVGDDGCTESHREESEEFIEAILNLIAEATSPLSGLQD